MIGLTIIGFSYPRVSYKYLENIRKSAGVKLRILQKIRSICGSIKRAKLANEDNL